MILLNLLDLKYLNTACLKLSRKSHVYFRHKFYSITSRLVRRCRAVIFQMNLKFVGFYSFNTNLSEIHICLLCDNGREDANC